MSPALNPAIAGLRFGDRGTIPLAAGGRGSGEIVAYRGAHEKKFLAVRLDARGPDGGEIVVWVPIESFKPVALLVPGAAA